MQGRLTLGRRLAEVTALLATMVAVTVVLFYLLESYNGPLSGTYFDALIASPFLLVIVFLMAAHLQLRRFRSRNRLS